MKFGVIEDINDPLESGRVKVRIFGLHTDDSALIPTESLPWAMCLCPIQSGSVSGIGISPTGIVQGAWVAVEFLDNDNQYPIVVGSIHGRPVKEKKDAVGEELTFSDNSSNDQNIVRDSSGNPITTTDGTPVTTGEPPKEPEPNKPVPLVEESPNDLGRVIPSKLGSVSAKHESNGNPGTVNKYGNGDDLGGASYGAYQFASYLKGADTPTRDSVTTSQIKNSPINQFLKSSKFSSEFTGLSPATPEFDAAWKKIGQSNKVDFMAEQHKYIEKNYYQVLVDKLPASISNRKKAIHEAVWSMSVQHGPGMAAGIIKNAIGQPASDVCDSKLIEILYQYRIDNVQVNFKSSQKLWPGLIKRFNQERDELIKLAKTYEGERCGVVQAKVEEVKKVEFKEETKEVVVEKKITIDKSSVPPTTGPRGFVDPDGEFPRRYNEVDVSRLARGVITDTAIERKRRSLVASKEAGDHLIDEPQTQYNTKYPFNKVTETISGHVVELDDTPGYERIHVYHSSGSFIEVHPNGSFVVKSKKNITQISSENTDTVIGGSQRTHVANNSDTSVMGNLTLVVHGNAKVNIDGNADVHVGGNANMLVDGNFDTVVGKDATLTCGGKYSVKAQRIDLN
jgi:hypothetical protein